MKVRNMMLLAVLSLGLGLSACEKKEETTAEKVVDAVGDATNTRDNEGMKDAGEDAAAVVENAAEEVKEAVTP